MPRTNRKQPAPAITLRSTCPPVGQSKETVTVTADAPPLQTDSAVVGVVLQNRVVNELPLNFGSGGRDVENFAIQLAPGVAGSASGTEILGTPQFSKEVSGGWRNGHGVPVRRRLSTEPVSGSGPGVQGADHGNERGIRQDGRRPVQL